MLQTIDIPSPSGADTENVVTALEAAAIFGAKGDAQEAMHWLRRAAEAAGAAGDDERALSLSRIAADLHDEVSGTQSIASRTPPSIPRVSPTPPPSAGVSYPPPPSSRSARPPSVLPRPSQVPRPSAAPPTVGASRPPLALVPSLPAAATAPAEPVAAPPPPLPEVTPTPAPALETPPPTSVRPTPSSTGARHAARVAVSISTTKVGYLEVRLLNEGEAPRLGSSEALLVMLDPTSTLLAR